MIGGTPYYMAPEQSVGDAVDHRADLYALGCVAYWLLTARTVFEAPSPVAMLMQHVREPPVAPSRRAELPVPPELDAIILECLAKDPADRPADAMKLYHRLADCPAPEPWSRTRAERWWRLHLPELLAEAELPGWGQEEETTPGGDAALITSARPSLGAGPPGFEPGLPAPKAGVLPLDEGPGNPGRN